MVKTMWSVYADPHTIEVLRHYYVIESRVQVKWSNLAFVQVIGTPPWMLMITLKIDFVVDFISKMLMARITEYYISSKSDHPLPNVII